MFNTKILTTMAKNNMLLGYARGKVGDLVFQRRKGEQIVKARNRNPANPRTWAQQMQRVRMYAPVQFYKTAVENFYRFAFEDKKYNETDYNAFIRENLNAFQGPYFTKAQVLRKFPVMAPFVLSSGTLGNIPTAESATSSSANNKIFVSISVGVTELDAAGRTVGNVSRLLMNKYNLYEGDQITFIAQIIRGITIGTSGLVDYNGDTTFNYQTFTIDTTSEETIPVNSGEITNGLYISPSPTGDFNEIAMIMANIIDGASTALVGYATIVTRRHNGKILASKTNMQLNESAKTYFETMSTSQQLIRAAQSYDASTSVLDPASAKVMNEPTSDTRNRNGMSTEQTAFNCLPSSGSKTTDGNPAFTLDNNCPSCNCPTPAPEQCEDETVTTTTTTTRQRTTTKTVKEE